MSSILLKRIALLSTVVLSLANTDEKRIAIQKSELLYKDIFNSSIVMNQIKSDSMANGKTRADVDGSDELKEKDDLWKSWSLEFYKYKEGKVSTPLQTPDWIATIVNNPCSVFLKEKMAQYGATEIFVINKVGTTVCAAEPTSDFDQGDEPKWSKIYEKNEEYFIDRERRDPSAGARQIQISFPMADANGVLNGVVVIGVSGR